jgi:long-chain acyl-CoA synthetase
VYADPNQFKPIAIAVPAEAALRKFVEANGIATVETSLDSLVKDQNVVSAVYTELVAAGKRGGLTRMELIQGLVLVSEEWTPENVHPNPAESDIE